jgi:hypothetical protein
MPRSCYVGGMETALLPLQVASGILIAVTLVWFFRLGLALAQKGEWQWAMFAFIPTGLVGGGLILAGLGLVVW